MDVQREEASTPAVSYVAGRGANRGRKVNARASAQRVDLEKVSRAPGEHSAKVSKRTAGYSVRRAKIAAQNAAADKFLASLAKELAI